MVNFLEIDGRRIELDDDFCLKNPDDWSEQAATLLAHEEGIELTAAHWKSCIWYVAFIWNSICAGQSGAGALCTPAARRKKGQ
jgi:sulfur relay (sulfurtransferase) DsrC/TusE family protein